MAKIVREFEIEINQPEPDIGLARGALLIAKAINPRVKVAATLAKLDAMAQTVRDSAGDSGSPDERFDALNEYFFEQESFSGNRADYYNPQNSFLDYVLLTKIGLPITLSVIYLEIGWRLELPVAGIGLPGHFVVAYFSPDETIYVDPFNDGQFLTEDDCMDIAQVPEDDRIPFQRDYLKPMTKKAILYRMLLNLKHVYVTHQEWDRAHRVTDLLVSLRPGELNQLRDRGLIAYRLDRLQDAVFDIQQYLLQNPNASDADWLNNHLESLRAKLLRLN